MLILYLSLGSELAYVKSAYPNLAGFAVYVHLAHYCGSRTKYIGRWAAGAFETSYVLSVTPNGNQDQPLWVQAVQPNLP